MRWLGNGKDPLVVIKIDVEKAFDCLHHSMIIKGLSLFFGILLENLRPPLPGLI